MGRVESLIQADIIAYLRGLDATYCVNYPGSAAGAKGTPDLIVCHRGRFFAFEIKRPDGSYGTSRAQEKRILQIQKAGGSAHVVTSIKDVAAALREGSE